MFIEIKVRQLLFLGKLEMSVKCNFWKSQAKFCIKIVFLSIAKNL
jgi:hypothetical protein